MLFFNELVRPPVGLEGGAVQVEAGLHQEGAGILANHKFESTTGCSSRGIHQGCGWGSQARHSTQTAESADHNRMNMPDSAIGDVQRVTTEGHRRGSIESANHQWSQQPGAPSGTINQGNSQGSDEAHHFVRAAKLDFPILYRMLKTNEQGSQPNPLLPPFPFYI